tara:strand:- start:38122 stop:38925 length:804 start_codon:yes stop_codon:yes gene_type:complete
MKVFVLTDNLGLRSDDQYLVDALEALNVNTVICDWETVDLSGPCNVLIRTPWNYIHKITKFLAKIREVEKSGGKILHNPKIVQWNSHKSYLEQCAYAVKTQVIRINQDTELSYPVVIKPVYGAGGVNTYCVKSYDEYLKLSPHFGEEFLVQPYIENITREGEYSFIFFQHHFSHAVLKKAQTGEFRVQDDFGGIVEKYTPDDEEIRQVQKILNTFPHRYEYARVDFVKENGKILLMELEVIEPELFFRTEPKSASVFAKNIIEYFES